MEAMKVIGASLNFVNKEQQRKFHRVVSCQAEVGTTPEDVVCFIAKETREYCNDHGHALSFLIVALIAAMEDAEDGFQPEDYEQVVFKQIIPQLAALIDQSCWNLDVEYRVEEDDIILDSVSFRPAHDYFVFATYLESVATEQAA